MGATLAWRYPPERAARHVAEEIVYGNLRDRGRAYMSRTERVGPGVLILVSPAHEAPARFVADRLAEDGFTVLVPALPEPDEAGRLVATAADHLLENWHPRLGVVAFEAWIEPTAQLIDRRCVDAAVFCPGPATSAIPMWGPALIFGSATDWAATVDGATRREAEVELIECGPGRGSPAELPEDGPSLMSDLFHHHLS